jgi:hypothetical protein
MGIQNRFAIQQLNLLNKVKSPPPGIVLGSGKGSYKELLGLLQSRIGALTIYSSRGGEGSLWFYRMSLEAKATFCRCRFSSRDGRVVGRILYNSTRRSKV